VLYNGVDLQEFCLDRQPATSIGNWACRRRRHCWARSGRLVYAKARRAAPRGHADRDQVPSAHYVIVGQRHSEKEESRRFERDLHNVAAQLPHRVHFLGVRNDVCRLLNELTLLMHTARQEPLGRVLLEAAAAGTAIIATRVGGTPEIFPPEENAARLVPPDDAGALGDAILELPRRSCHATSSGRCRPPPRGAAVRHSDLRRPLAPALSAFARG